MSQLLEQGQPAVSTGANDILARFDHDSTFFFSSPRFTLHGRGMQSRIRGQVRGAELLQQVDDLFDGAPRQGEETVVAGALPFEEDEPAVIFIPEQVQRGGPLDHARLTAPSKERAHVDFQVRQVPDPVVYMNAVEEALHRFETTPLRKVVLARALEVAVEGDINAQRLLLNLVRNNPQGYTFAIDVPSHGAHSVYRPLRLMGASPELLVSRRGMQVVANPIAGTLPRSSDPVEDAERALALQSSVKDQYEHALVVQAVMAALQPYCRNLHVPLQPTLIKTSTLWHLSTVIRGDLLDPATTSLQLARSLHPTPAVCGYPRDLAQQAIRDLEPFQRGLFTGLIGWCDRHGDGEWAVTIRCAEVEDRRVRLFAGAGIVADSVPEKELAETGAKFMTMLNAMDLPFEAGRSL